MFEFLKKLFKKEEVVNHVEETELSDAPEETEDEILPTEGKIIFRVPVPQNKGKVCINNGEVNRYIGKDEPIPDGWTLGGKKRG